jgi:uncharacterized protein
MSSIKSPCILVCFISPDTGLCMGCHRTIDEIEHWIDYTDKQRDEIMEQLSARENSTYTQ